MVINIPYKPRNWAKALHAAKVRWILMVLHRRAGKTTAVLNHLQRDALRIPNSQFAYIGPTQKQTKRIAWKIAKRISKKIPGIFYHDTELYVRYPNGSLLFLAGSDNIDALRGIPLWGAAGDEWPLQKRKLFTEVISKCLADHLGYFIFLGTPKGKNHFYKTYKNALKNPKEWLVIFKTIDDSLREETGETIENLRQALADDRKLVKMGEMTEDELNQEWYCSFEAAVQGAYYSTQIARARREGRIGLVPYDPKLLVYTVTDLGVGRNMATGFYQRSGMQLRKIDYHECKNKEGLPALIRAIKNKPYVYGKHFGPHDLAAADVGTGKTRLDIAKELGLEFEMVPKLNVIDGIRQGQLAFDMLWVDETKCELWVDHIAQYQEKEIDGVPTGKPLKNGHDHAGDEWRYTALVADQMVNDVSGKMDAWKKKKKDLRGG